MNSEASLLFEIQKQALKNELNQECIVLVEE